MLSDAIQELGAIQQRPLNAVGCVFSNIARGLSAIRRRPLNAVGCVFSNIARELSAIRQRPLNALMPPNDGFFKSGRPLASERFSKSGNWKPLPANSLLTIRGRDNIESSALC